MGYYSESGVIQGIHFEDIEWTTTDSDRFYTVANVTIPAKLSCDHHARLGHKFCPICGVKTKDRKAKEKKTKDWHSFPADLIESAIGKHPSLVHVEYTDTNVWWRGIGREVAKMESGREAIRGVEIPTLDEESYDELLEELRALNLFSDEFILNHFGTWFIQGGS